jgi:hypothetical protein
VLSYVEGRAGGGRQSTESPDAHFFPSPGMLDLAGNFWRPILARAFSPRNLSLIRGSIHQAVSALCSVDKHDLFICLAL